MLKVGPFYQFSTTHLSILYSGKLFSSWLKKKKNLLLCALWVFLKLHKNKKFSLAFASEAGQMFKNLQLASIYANLIFPKGKKLLMMFLQLQSSLHLRRSF